MLLGDDPGVGVVMLPPWCWSLHFRWSVFYKQSWSHTHVYIYIYTHTLSSDLYKMGQALALLVYNDGINHTKYITKIFNVYICPYNKFLFVDSKFFLEGYISYKCHFSYHIFRQL